MFPKTKHVRKTFQWLYEQDHQYTSFMTKNTRLKTAWTKSFQGYCRHRMAIASQHNTARHQQLLEQQRKARQLSGQHGDRLSKEQEAWTQPRGVGGAVDGSELGRSIVKCVQEGVGLRDGHGGRSQSGDQGGSHDQDRHPAEGDREVEEAGRDVDSTSEIRQLAHGEMHVQPRVQSSVLYSEIDKHIEFLEREFALILETQRETKQHGQWGLDLLEVYCGETSEITRQALNLGLRAKRFTVNHGDLSTAEGQQRLWSLIRRERPREIWVAPECGPWGNFSRLNMSRSTSTADRIHKKRHHKRVHLRLCNEIFLHQMTVGGNFHMEQPQGSELILQPEVRDIRVGTSCTTFDMCEVGKLLAPQQLKQKRGNNYLRKRTTVYTSSLLFHRAFDHRYCSKNHDHVRIEGKVLHLGRWISVSEYAARYSSGFGRNVARYLAIEVPNLPVWWDELQNSGCSVDPAFVGEVMRRRALPGTSEGERREGPAKRPRLLFKQPAIEPEGHAGTEFWQDVFQRADPLVPRVGKRSFVDDEIMARVQEGVPGMKVHRVEACRGTERYRLPDEGLDQSCIPLRLTVVRKRESGQLEVLGVPEEWTKLTRQRKIRKNVPASLSLTIFGEPQESPSASSGDVSSQAQTESSREVYEGDLEEPGGGPPRNVARHGPGFLRASPEVKAQIRRLHHNLGHPDAQRFFKFLRERQAEASVIQAALDFQCDSCLEAQKGHAATRPATIHEDVGFNSVVGMDTVTWTSRAGQRFTFLHAIDEGTLFHVATPSGTSQEALMQAFQRMWMSWAGPPQTVYVDPASSFNSETWRDQMQALDVRIKMTAAEAHWQLGRVEIHGGVLNRMMDRMDSEHPVTSPDKFEKMLMLACNAKNSLSRIRGYSPEQAVLGISSRLPASITSCENENVGSHALADSATEASERFQETLKMRTSARKAFIDADNSSALRRALLRRTRPMRGPYEVGDWILYWRQRGPNLRRVRGQWHGPACVVAVEGNRNIWMNHSGRLVRASPEQVRPASFREWKAVEQAVSQGGGSFADLRGGLQAGTFIDLEDEPLPSREDELAEDAPSEQSLTEPEAEIGQRALEPDEGSDPRDVEMDGVDVPVPESEGSESDILFGDDVTFSEFSERSSLMRWEVDLTPPEEIYCCMAGSPDEVALTASEARKKKVEIKMSNLSADDQFLFAKAKHKEITAWLKHGTVRKVSKGRIPDHAIMRCRWILSWKTANGTEKPCDVKNGQKAKARLVVVGFEDPDIGELSSDAPTLTKDGRQMVLQLVSSNKWELLSFDVSTAFLRGDGDGRLLGLHPPPELFEALEMSEHDDCELLKGAYGRVDAPFLWYKKFRDTLLGLGFRQCPLDPCVFSYTSGTGQELRVHGAIGIHVDDGIGGGDKVFLQKLEEIRAAFEFGSFEKRSFVFTGISLKQWDDGSIEMDQGAYVERIPSISISKMRRQEPTSPLTSDEISAIRSLIGALQYAAVHTRPDISARVGELQSGVPKATVQLLLDGNKLLAEAKANPLSIMVLPIASKSLTLCAFSDASFLSGTERFAHQGALIFATTPELLENERAVVAPVAWISKKIHRVTRSTLGAEAIALSGAVDRLLWLRILWAWLIHPEVDWKNPEMALQRERQAALVTDCKSAYDLLTTVAVPQCEEHRTTIECLLIRERLQSNCAVRWVTSGAQLADCLTKSMDPATLRSCLKSGRYCLYDEKKVLKQRSDKKQRQKWIRDATSGAQDVACMLADLHDFWETSTDGLVVRVHQVPRTRLFAPIGLSDCPVPLDELCLERTTYGKSLGGGTWHKADFWPGSGAAASQGTAWVGKTVFRKKKLC